MIINNYADSAEHDPECSYTEEIRAAIEDFNDLDDEQKKKCVLASMDVKTLVRVVACAVTETKCPLLTALFLFLSFFSPGYFSPRRGYRRVPKFCMGF